MSCDCDTLIVGEAGPQGAQGLAGINGTNGTNGVNAYTTLSASFTQPIVGNTVNGVSVAENSWMAVGQVIYVSQAGYYTVAAVGPGTTSVDLTLVQTDGIVNPSTVSSSRKISPGGRGAIASSLNSLSVSGDSSLDGALVVNESGANKDVRIEGDTDANLVFTDASADYVGIGTNTPATKLHVSGGLRVTGSSDLRGPVVINEAADALSDVRVEGQTSPNLIFVDSSTNQIGINTGSPASLVDINGNLNASTVVVNPSGASGNAFTVLGASSANRIYSTDDAVGIGTSSPSVVAVGAGETNLSVNGVLNAKKLAVTSGSVTSGITGIYFGSFTFSGTFLITANTTTYQDVTATGASQGDFVLAGPPAPNASGYYTDVMVQAEVLSANTVRVLFRNFSPSTAYSFTSASVLKVLVFSAQALP